MSTDHSPQASPAASTYDETPYPSAAFPQTHPNRLAAMARLFGIPAKDPSKARVLELGCADGTNLLPMAGQLPEARFLGIDSSSVQISAGQRVLAAVGLKNIELRLQNILEFPASEGKFDYIIAHGVYSWVPDEVREKVLSICAEHLAENGVAYVSYNAHPGWNLRRSLRDMMLFHMRNFGDPKTKVAQARALLTFMAESVPAENNAYGMLLRAELNQMSALPDNYLLHDILNEENTAFYFHEFVGRATTHGLQYLSEPSIVEMLAANFPERVRQTLGQLNNNLVAQEQYMDFLRNRSFRQTLLCHAGAKIQRDLSAELLTQFSFRSQIRSATGPVELVPGVAVSFVATSGVQVTSSDAFVKAILLTLTETKGVAAIAYRDLLDSARARSRPFLGEIPPDRNTTDEATLQTNLMNFFARGLIEVYAEPVRVRTDVPEKPAASAVARHEALHARMITNRMHLPVPADLVSRYVLAACDGTRSHADIVSALIERVGEGALQVNEGSAKVTEPEKLRTLFTPRVEAMLAAIANGGFFAP